MSISKHSLNPIESDLALELCQEAVISAESHLQNLKSSTSALATNGGKIDSEFLLSNQYAIHGFAWMATYIIALKQFLSLSEKLS